MNYDIDHLPRLTGECGFIAVHLLILMHSAQIGIDEVALVGRVVRFYVLVDDSLRQNDSRISARRLW